MFVLGTTVTAEVNVLPAQPCGLVGVIVNVVVTVLVEELVRIPVTGFAAPGLVIPVMVPVWFLVQLKVVPIILLLVLRSICAMAVPEQMLCAFGVATPTGLGLTVRVTMFEVTFPQIPLTLQRYCLPLMARETFERL